MHVMAKARRALYKKVLEHVGLGRFDVMEVAKALTEDCRAAYLNPIHRDWVYGAFRRFCNYNPVNGKRIVMPERCGGNTLEVVYEDTDA